jgi:hypothetical protein
MWSSQVVGVSRWQNTRESRLSPMLVRNQLVRAALCLRLHRWPSRAGAPNALYLLSMPSQTIMRRLMLAQWTRGESEGAAVASYLFQSRLETLGYLLTQHVASLERASSADRSWLEARSRATGGVSQKSQAPVPPRLFNTTDRKATHRNSREQRAESKGRAESTTHQTSRPIASSRLFPISCFCATGNFSGFRAAGRPGVATAGDSTQAAR